MTVESRREYRKEERDKEKIEETDRREGCRWLDGLARLLGCKRSESDTITMTVVIGPEVPRQPLEGNSNVAKETTLGFNGQRDIDLTNLKDANGKPASFEGAVVWASSDEAVSDVRLRDPEAGLHAVVGSFELNGVAAITASGKRKGSGTTMVGTLNVTVAEKPGDVESVDVTISEETQRLDINPL